MKQQLHILIFLIVLPLQLWSKDLTSLYNKANSGNRDAAYELGMVYKTGNGVFQDNSEAFDWLLKAAKWGHRDAQFEVGIMYFSGIGVNRNELEAQRWLKDAARQKHINACLFLGKWFYEMQDSDCEYWLGNAISYNKSIAKDSSAYFYIGDYKYSKCKRDQKAEKECKEWKDFFQTGAKEGDIKCIIRLAELYDAEEIDANDNELEAFLLYKKAAKRGHYESIIELASRCAEGKGTRINKDSVIYWYVKAYDTKHERWIADTIAQLCLSLKQNQKALSWFRMAHYSDMEIGDFFYQHKDYTQALDLYKLDNSPEAFYKLAMMYENGYGTSKDKDLEKQYLEKAAVLNNSQLFKAERWNRPFIVEQNKLKIDCYTCVDEGYAPALYQLGKLSEEEQEYEEAAKYYRRAIIKDNDDAKVALAILLQKTKVKAVKGEDGPTKLLTQALNNGNSNAKLQRGYMYLEGIGGDKDSIQALRWIKEAAESDNIEAQEYLGSYYMDTLKRAPDYSNAFYWLQKAETHDNCNAQNRLGWLYEHGYGTEISYRLAFECYEHAVLNPNRGSEYANALYNYARAHEKGIGTSANPQKAVTLYEQAADGYNYTPARVAIGIIYLEGKEEIQIDYTKAFSYFQAAAYEYNPDALWYLGHMYEYALGLKKVNKSVALRYYTQAANSNIPEYQYRLGQYYYNGTITPKNFGKAEEYFKMAADNGHTQALMSLAHLYETGMGPLKKNTKLALQRYLTAANQGCVEAMLCASRLYETGGGGIIPDYQKAQEWKQKAEIKQRKNQNIEVADQMNEKRIRIISPKTNSHISSRRLHIDYEQYVGDDRYPVELIVNGNPCKAIELEEDPASNTRSLLIDLPEAKDGQYDVKLKIKSQEQKDIWSNSIILNYRQPDLWILSVGINDYEHFDKLYYAANDAEEFYHLAINLSEGTFGHIDTTLLKDKNATRTNILNSLDKITENLHQGDRVLIYLSGHGSDHSRKPYFASVEATKKNSTNGVEFQDINDYLLMMKENGGQVILFVDACYAGLLFTDKGDGKRDDWTSIFEKQEPGIYKILSCSDTQKSRESHELKHGIFSYALFQGITSEVGVKRQDGIVNLEELFRFIKDKVKSLSDGRQTPQSNIYNRNIILFY